jgi:S-methylmethionine-dependent homocysteine/selenocysteine methylase
MTSELPQLGERPFLTDSGLETDLVFHHDVDLPAFAAFPLLGGPQEGLLRDYYASHVAVAEATGLGIVLETPTWRANTDWGAELGYDAPALARANGAAVALLGEARAGASVPVVVSGCLGPRGDGYVVDRVMTPTEAAAYHAPQVEALAAAGADLVTVLTVTYAAEGSGIALAARQAGLPVVVSFTVETDGRLPDGSPVDDAVAEVDAATDGYPAYFMLNCAHPDHYASAPITWGERLRGVRANASRMSHAELDDSEVLDDGDPLELGHQLAGLHRTSPGVTVLGGCCGTDVRHIRELASVLSTSA